MMKESEIKKRENQRTCILQISAELEGNPGPAGAAAILLDENRTVLFRFRKGLGDDLMGDNQTYDAAHYRALILGLNQAKMKGYNSIIVESNLQSLINQIKGSEPVEQYSRDLWMEASRLKETFCSFNIRRIIGVDNEVADEEAEKATRLWEGEFEEEDSKS
ncbi:uncharacterized protein LOC131644026 [Vicia villosa]|uniref:uncharacterized protein LOC131644026 n=1 Tax=Vicia villosa TaxID=3911 RepID=UPI00273B3143|nr:uncharacterized protein LOC131644026 [Vicia villosa]